MVRLPIRRDVADDYEGLVFLPEIRPSESKSNLTKSDCHRTRTVKKRYLRMHVLSADLRIMLAPICS